MTIEDSDVEDAMNRLPDDAEVSESEVRAQIEELHNEYDLPVDNAVNSVVNRHTSSDSSGGGSQGPAEQKDLADINEDEEWVTVRAEVDQQFNVGDSENSPEQAGLLADATGRIKFVTWGDFPKLEPGKSYEIETTVNAREEDQRYPNQLKLVEGTTSVTEIADIDQTRTLIIPIIGLRSGDNSNGLVRVCDEDDCEYTLDSNNECFRHGDPDTPEKRLGIEAIADDGVSQVKTLQFDSDQTEEISGYTIDEAKQVFADDLSDDAIVDAIKDKIVGKWVQVEATGFGGDRWTVEDFEIVSDREVKPQEVRDVADRVSEVITV